MKIIYTCKSKIPSIEANSIHVMKMCQAFSQNGHNIKLIAPRIRRQKIIKNKDELSKLYGINPTFDFEYMFSFPGLMGRDFCYRASKKAKKQNIDFMYTRYLGVASWSASFGVPTIFEAHAPIRDEFYLSLFKKLLRGNGFKHLVVISEKLKEIYLDELSEFIPSEKIRVVHDGVDLERFAEIQSVEVYKNKIEVLNDKFTVGYAGHLYEGRGIELILELAKRLPKINFLIVGGKDNDVVKYKDKAKELKLKNIVFFGFIDNCKLQNYLLACDVLLMPYQNKVSVSQGGGNSVEWMSPIKMFKLEKY